MIRNSKMLAKRIQALEARTTDKLNITFTMVATPEAYTGPGMTCTEINEEDGLSD